MFCRDGEGAVAKLLSQFRAAILRLIVALSAHPRGCIQREHICRIQISQQQERSLSITTEARRTARKRLSDCCQRATTSAHSVYSSWRSTECNTDKQWHHRLQSWQVLTKTKKERRKTLTQFSNKTWTHKKETSYFPMINLNLYICLSLRSSRRMRFYTIQSKTTRIYMSSKLYYLNFFQLFTWLWRLACKIWFFYVFIIIIIIVFFSEKMRRKNVKSWI